MNDIRIAMPGTPDRSYSVRPCAGPRDIASRLAGISRGARVFIVSDRNVDRIHGSKLRRALSQESIDFRWLVVPAGERSKSRRTRDLLEDRMIRAGAERSSVVAAFGGGVVGDLAGFTASTLFRGIRFVQVPTTLIAQADSAVGGKVGIDHPLGKNLLGAFHQPEAVLLHAGYLQSLPEREYLQGMAEVIKTALILDGRLVNRLQSGMRAIRSRDRETLQAIVARCCTLKGRVVEADERETGDRRILNFGHTIGHALERASGFRIPHGFAVSIGMAVEAGIALRLGMIGTTELAGILGLLEAYDLPVSVPRTLSRSGILRAIAFDKKKSGGVVGFTLPSGIGKGVCGIEVPGDVLTESLRP
jgi:3-dehydroquinate synthase